LKNLTIRLEQPKDYRAVEELTRAAFDNPERIESSKIGCPMEHHMVHRLREKDGIMELNFVAEMNGRIVGHIIYSHAHILQSDGSKVSVLNFGPISVWPELQRTGIGGALMKHSLAEAKKLGFGAVLFFGHPEYYPRFGFVEAKEFGITDCSDNNYPSFMAMELVDGYLKDVFGKFVEADIYNDDLNREQAGEFDRLFLDR
jgi:predicted N-acetyltransferase YhbS